MHDFPSADGLSHRTERLGELLASWQAVDPDKIELALNDGHAREAPLGRVLLAKGWLDEETLAEAIAFQADLERGSLDAARITRDAARLPLEICIRHRVLMQGEHASGRAIVLTAGPLAEKQIAAIEAQAGQPIVQRIVREGEIAAGLRLLRGVAPIQPMVAGERVTEAGRTVPLLGDLLIERGYVRRSAFDTALQNYRPNEHGRIGDYMVALEVISREALNNVIQEQRRLGNMAAV